MFSMTMEVCLLVVGGSFIFSDAKSRKQNEKLLVGIYWANPLRWYVYLRLIKSRTRAGGFQVLHLTVKNVRRRHPTPEKRGIYSF